MGIGLIIVHLIGKAFSYEIPFYFYPIGAFLSLLPDVDFIWAVLKRETGAGHRTHRRIPHYPIVMIGLLWLVLGISSIFWPILVRWALIGTLCLLGHYIHDSLGLKLGIPWLAPWKDMFFMIWPPAVLTKEEVDNKNLIDSREWVVKTFLHPTPEAVSNASIFFGALFLVWLW